METDQLITMFGEWLEFRKKSKEEKSYTSAFWSKGRDIVEALDFDDDTHIMLVDMMCAKDPFFVTHFFEVDFQIDGKLWPVLVKAFNKDPEAYLFYKWKSVSKDSEVGKTLVTVLEK